MADLMDEAIEISHKLIPCNICGRTFLPSPLKKHAKVCEKNATRKRKTFNSLKQRIEGTELAVFHQKSYLRKGETICQSVPAATAAATVSHAHVSASAANEEKRNQSKWKEKHEELVQAIRAAKGENIMAPRRSISAVGNMGTTEQCPSCDRHFGPKAYDRHVEWCKEHKIRVSKSPAVVTIAKERLEARTKYRVPPLNKSKRSVTRDKYASPSGRGPEAAAAVAMHVRSTICVDHPNTKKIKQKSVPALICPPLTEPVIKHNVEKLKSFGKSMTKHENKKHPLSPLKRSVSLSMSNPVVKARSMKNKQDIQDYLHVREQKTSRDELFPIGHDMYNEYKKYEEMYRREQDENDEISSNEEQECTPAQPERHYPNVNQTNTSHNQNTNTNTNPNAADSAYGSLNRKSPKVAQNSRQAKTMKTTKTTTQQHIVKRSPSSSGSGSETCPSIPPKKNNNRLTKFCHECGTKYPLDCAKFCVECGIKRLVL